MIVIDTNIIAYYYIESEYTQLAKKLFQDYEILFVPPLWRSEFRNVLCSYYRYRELSLNQIENIMQNAELLLAEYTYTPSNKIIFDLVTESDCSAHDCEFVAIAKELNLPLITMDKKVCINFPETAISLVEFLK